MTSGMKLAFALTVGGLLTFSGTTARLAFAQDEAAQAGPEKPDFPPFNEVIKGYTKVNGPPGDPTLLTLYTRDKDQQMLLEFPREFARQKHLIAMTISTGETFAGLQGPSIYAYWKRYDKRLALVAPQIQNRSTGDNESKIGVDRVFTDRVLVDVPILAMSPAGGPIIDADALFSGQVGRFFGGGGFMSGGGAGGANPSLATIKKAKAFKENMEIAFEMPTNGGLLKSFYYSIRNIPENTGYTPRAADERVGYFQTWYRDLGKFKEDEKWVRYINRWNIEKADPKLKLSPPKQPIVYYIEHTVPVRYRRYIRDGVQFWNKAFEKVGIVDAIEVRIQDKATGQHMDKDPEDSQYNFIRWVSNDISTAIGPSRVNPLTGEILDADVVLTDGWIRAFWTQSNEIIPDIAMRGMNDEVVEWLASRPEWDPRVRLAAPQEREMVKQQLSRERAAMQSSRGITRFGGVAISDGSMTDGLAEWGGRSAALSAGNCLAAQGKSVDMGVMRMAMELFDMFGEEQPEDAAKKDEPKKDDDKKDEKKDEKKKEPVDLIDGIPEWFVGPSLADLVAHEVGHTLGLRHNFKASSIYSYKDINSESFKGKRAYSTSVMDYNPVNVCLDKSLVQGDYMQLNLGAYDFWAIEYGYGSGDPKKVASRAAEPELQYGSDEDAGGMDATVRRYDLAANPLDYAKARMELAKSARARVLDKFVRDGQSWSKARRGYQLSLGMQMDGISIMSNWVGAARVYRDRKGDPNGRPPIDVVPAETQREALKFVIETAFNDESYGLTPELIKYFTVDRAEDPGVGRGDPEWAVHDQIAGVQSSALTMLINPAQMRRVLDNEFRVPADKDMITAAEVLDTVCKAIFSELDAAKSGSFTNRQPMISSIRRNLQREMIDRLIDLSFPNALSGEAAKPISNLATARLRELKAKLEDASKRGNADAYSAAHMSEAAIRIGKAIDAQYIYNTNMFSGGGGGFSFFGQPAPAAAPAPAGEAAGDSSR